MGWRIAITEQAITNLEAAVAFLTAKSPAAAERLGMGLVDSIFRLADFPLHGMAVEARSGYRRVLHRPWHLIFYRLDEAAKIV